MLKSLVLRLTGFWREAVCLSRGPEHSRQVSEVPLIVSLTSYPARIEKVWRVIVSIRSGRVVPSRLILVLAESQFPGRILPSSLLRTGVEILWVGEDSRSYKKLIPVANLETGLPIVTADDDCLYGPNWLSELWRAHNQDTRAVLGWRGSTMVLDGDALRPYAQWPGADTQTPSELVFLKGDGGILYPPTALTSDLLDLEKAIELCPTADDVWFKAACLAAGHSTRRIVSGDFDVPTLLGSQGTSLRAGNVGDGENDRQLAAAFSYFGIDLG